MAPFKFFNPGRVRLRSRFEGEHNYVETSNNYWKWYDAGNVFSISWNDLKFDCELENILKSFIIHRFESRSQRTVGSMDARFLIALSKSTLQTQYPWSSSNATQFLTSLRTKPDFFTFRAFYTWAVQKNIHGFDVRVLMLLGEIQPFQRQPYLKAYQQTDIISPSDQILLLNLIETEFDYEDYFALRDNILVHLGFELAPRPTQIFSLNESDIEYFKSDHESGKTYYTIWLPMAKKISSNSLGDKRPRSVSEKLGMKICELLKMNNSIFKDHGNQALIRDSNGQRLAASKISKIVCSRLFSIGFQKGDGLKFLRHNLAQSLADQGSSPDVIAEILGHNSLIPARAYVASTSELSNIKTRALGKNDTYKELMKMFLTGEITERKKYPKERWAKGVVGGRYITGIGGCGLNKSTPCPYDPVYSCYTCKKFHPFSDGIHTDVKLALQQQAQYFVDTANNAMDLESNRAVIQLETTIHAVDQVIKRCGK